MSQVRRKPYAKKRTSVPLPRLDPDRVSLPVALICATVVMALGFLRDVDELEVAFRAGITFAATWTATFLLLAFFSRVARLELTEVEQKEEPSQENSGNEEAGALESAGDSGETE